MAEQEILLRYHEIAIKGDNRGWFEDRLAMNARKLLLRVLPRDSEVTVERIHGRILLKSEWNEETEFVLKNRLFGLSSFSPMIRVSTHKDEILKRAVEEFQLYANKYGLPKRFKVSTRRSEKALSDTSVEIDRYVGAAIQERFPSLIVDLDEPDFTLGIEVRFGESFIWTEKLPGQGGLPVGCNAPVLTLISGGIDSPVAAIQTLRRGSPSYFIHFYGTPFVGEEVLEKIGDLVKIVNRYQTQYHPLLVVPFGKIQEKIALVTNPKMRTLLYRRMMVRIANSVAKQLGAKALITGESLGQVASQTVENLGTVDAVTELPILRPLIAFDKDEIIERARKWGTYETSIRPAIDCCTLFADRHPRLRSDPTLLEEEELKFSVSDLVEEGLQGTIQHFGSKSMA